MENIMVNALSWRHMLIAMLEMELLGFKTCIWMIMTSNRQEGFLFREKNYVCPRAPTKNISVDFVVGLPRTLKGRTSIFVMKSDDACQMANLFFGEVTFWHKLVTKLMFCITWHRQTKGQTKVVNKMLSQLLRCFVGRNLKSWEIWLPHIEFSYNRVDNETTSNSFFKLVCRGNPLSPLDLIPLFVLSKADLECLSKASMVRLHKQVRVFMKKQGKRYVDRVNSDKEGRTFTEGDLGWVHLQKERFRHLRKS
ncbi:hypothetical protein CR513_20641, partial [Mucuna pruriens]